MELLSFVLKLTTVVSFSEFHKANRHPESGINILNAGALSAIYHWREVNCEDFVEGDYHKPRWPNGTEMIEAQADGVRGIPLHWNR